MHAILLEEIMYRNMAVLLISFYILPNLAIGSNHVDMHANVLGNGWLLPTRKKSEFFELFCFFC